MAQEFHGDRPPRFQRNHIPQGQKDERAPKKKKDKPAPYLRRNNYVLRYVPETEIELAGILRETAGVCWLSLHTDAESLLFAIPREIDEVCPAVQKYVELTSDEFLLETLIGKCNKNNGNGLMKSHPARPHAMTMFRAVYRTNIPQNGQRDDNYLTTIKNNLKTLLDC